MMKKILSIALVLVLCLTMLVACGKDDTKTDKGDKKPDDGSATTTVGGLNNDGTGTTADNGGDVGDNDTGLADAKAFLVAQYQKGDAKEPMVIKADKEVFASAMGYSIAWTVAVSEGDANAVKISTSDKANTMVIDIAENVTAAVTFTVTATVSDDKGNTETATFLFTIPGPVADPTPDSTLSIADAIELGASKAHNVYTSGKYYVEGTVVSVTSTQYGNMTIKDKDGNTLTIYGSFGPEGKEKFNELDPQPKSGDKVKLYGIIGQYNDTPQLKNGWIKTINGKKPGKAATTTRPSSSVKEPAADSNVSIADAIAIGLSKEDNTYTTNKYYVSGTVTEVYNEQYGNMKIKDDKGNILTLYGTFSADGKNKYSELKTKVKAGDTLTVYGKIGQFGGVAQIKNGWITKVNGKAPEVDASLTTTVPAQNVTAVDPAVGKAYKFGMIQQNVSKDTIYFITGNMSGYYMETTNNVSAAADVYLEATDGGYYMYAMVKGAKKYINMVISTTHVNGAFEDKPSTVYTYDASAKTIIGMAQPDGYNEPGPFWFGTRNDKEYTTVGPCDTKYSGFYCLFYEAK